MPATTQVRPLPPGVRARLDKLMLMLGSEHEGERASAAGMITALLKEHGLDWHDVVGSIGEPTRAAPAQPKPTYRSATPKYMTKAELEQLVRAIMRSPLNGRARQFLAGMTDKANIYGAVHFSDKQWHWLQDLARRAGAI